MLVTHIGPSVILNWVPSFSSVRTLSLSMVGSWRTLNGRPLLMVTLAESPTWTRISGALGHEKPVGSTVLVGAEVWVGTRGNSSMGVRVRTGLETSVDVEVIDGESASVGKGVGKFNCTEGVGVLSAQDTRKPANNRQTTTKTN